jgi:hypothetical protein
MQNFTDSDYALNKYNSGIVYRFADGSRVTVTLTDYLNENPGKTERDFAALKALSDAIYLDQVRAENAQTKKNVSVHTLKGGVPFEEAFLDALDRAAAAKAFAALLADDALTETQRRRFRLHVLEGLTFREIAKREGVAVRAVQKSVDAARRLLIGVFNKIS